MNFSWWTFALQAANFLILVWLLRRFLFKPVSAIVARRKEEIARGMAEASAEKQKALNLQRDLQAQRAGIEAERQKAIEEQGAQLAAERKKMIDEARAEAEKIRNHAATQLSEERAAATQELFSRTIELAVNLAERLLRGLAFPSIEHAFLTRVLDYLDRLLGTGAGRARFASGRDLTGGDDGSPARRAGRGAMARATRKTDWRRSGHKVQQRSGAYRRRRNHIRRAQFSASTGATR